MSRSLSFNGFFRRIKNYVLVFINWISLRDDDNEDLLDDDNEELLDEE